MSLHTQGLRILVGAALALSLGSSIAFAQRGDRGGERGANRSEARSGGGESRGGNRSQNRASSTRGGGRERGVSAESSRQSSRSSDRSESRGSVQNDTFRGQGQSNDQSRQRSYYRGPETGQFNTRRTGDDDRNRADRTDQFRQFDNDYQPRRTDRSELDSRNRDDNDWRSQVFGDNRDRFDRNRSDRRGDWQRTADRVRREWRGWDRGNVPFRYGWWDNYYGSSWPVYGPYRYSRWRDQPYYWWGWTSANRLTDWLIFGWNRPYYWNYGPGSNIYYRDDYVYYDDRRVMPADDYYQHVYRTAHDVPSTNAEEAEQMDWRPLGVFAITQGNESDSHRVVQLAVNKNGIISGTYYNRENGHVHPVTGRVDERSQRAAWSFADGEHESIVFETSIYNLTKSEASMMVHFGPGAEETQVWHLVRLEQPNTGERGSPNLPSPASSLP